MNDTLKKVLTEHADYIPLKKERVYKEEACKGDKIKPGYARMFDNMEDTYVRYDCADDDVVAAKLKIDFDILNRVKKIHFWVKLWSILLLIAIAVALLLMLGI